MHLIGFSHHYTKMHGQTHGLLLSVTSTKPLGHRPDDAGLHYDTSYVDFEEFYDEGVKFQRVRERGNHPLKLEDFDKPLLQLVFIGREHQIPFTTYREFPKDYKPIFPQRWLDSLPYSDLIGDLFAFKFKGEKLPKQLADTISTNRDRHVEIFN